MTIIAYYKANRNKIKKCYIIVHNNYVFLIILYNFTCKFYLSKEFKYFLDYKQPHGIFQARVN